LRKVCRSENHTSFQDRTRITGDPSEILSRHRRFHFPPDQQPERGFLAIQNSLDLDKPVLFNAIHKGLGSLLLSAFVRSVQNFQVETGEKIRV
tara:strand:- start:13188 stop:13466 length:279 start_codon:yes stop_codon:yes gene_type:complete